MGLLILTSINASAKISGKFHPDQAMKIGNSKKLGKKPNLI